MLNAENDSYDAFMTVKRVVGGIADYIRITTQTVSGLGMINSTIHNFNLAARAYT